MGKPTVTTFRDHRRSYTPVERNETYPTVEKIRWNGVTPRGPGTDTTHESRS